LKNYSKLRLHVYCKLQRQLKAKAYLFEW